MTTFPETFTDNGDEPGNAPSKGAITFKCFSIPLYNSILIGILGVFSGFDEVKAPSEVAGSQEPVIVRAAGKTSLIIKSQSVRF